jgi:hypothetical protein
MKNKLFSMMSLLAISITSMAQSTMMDNREKIIVGLKAGLNYANVYDTKGDQFNADPRWGFAGGGFVSVPIGKYLGIQPEVLYSQKGFSATNSILGNTYTYTRTTSYVDIPLYFAMKPVEFVTVLLGPQWSYLVHQSDTYNNTNLTVTQDQAVRNDTVRKNTLCFIGGLDINVNHFVLGARAGWDLNTNNGDGTTSNPRYKNAWFQGTIGFRIFN